MRRRTWMPGLMTKAKPALPDEREKLEIVAACDAFIRDVLKPRFLPEIRPSDWTYVIDIRGAWAGGRYRFLKRYRVGSGENAGEEFDAPFARLVRTGRDRFDIDWMRHTGQWWPLHEGRSLAQALHILETDGVLHPHC
ncbi:hypothetical protein HNR00_000906 [Methylorubrum rhodinum]|uniref:Uncharacterized protein n=1 Tax=Methylorubrum rhodinum TaxID=29428 RepID=A0A840ZGA0_9HYPH|nr:hypothetical protein [Methylorubrum rhodinum]MBB5756208.1 hypothetical protein [Methylorubrum rhodinum]